MSVDYVERFDPRILRRAAADETEEKLFWNFETYGGALETHYRPFSESLLIGYYPDLETDSPEFLSIGRNTIMRRVIGKDWGKDPRTARASLSVPFRDFVKPGYLSAFHTGNPVLEIISTTIETRDQQARCQYRRLVLPVHTRTGNRLLLSYCAETSN